MVETLASSLPDSIVAQAHDLLEAASRRELALAAAESCTGGLLSSLLTDVPGYSHVFERGFVVYSNDAKCELLDLDRQRLEDCGAVSREVAVAMAEGALRRSNADIAVAITGFAGPGGDDDEEGLVHFACGRTNGATRHREEHFGPVGRAGVRVAAIETALTMMKEALGSS